MAIESITISDKARNQLISIKKRLGFQNWNIPCRWAFCLSLAEKSIPPEEDIPSDSPLEMTWKTFGGKNADLYLGLLRQRAKNDGISLNLEDELNYFRLHLHRGISYLNNPKELANISRLLNLSVK